MVPKFPTKEPHITWDYLPILNLLKLDPQNHISLQTKLTPKNSYISIHVGADKKIRRIPPKLVIEIINYLKAKNQKVRIIGIEKEEVKEILDGTNHYPLYESGNLEDVKRWLCESSLTIASDSGLFHLSAALGKPTIGLYGPNLYSRSGSINENAVSIELDYICRPCNQNIGCPFNNRCMNDITLKQVVEKISKFNLF